jgi:hypothetical protein
MTGPLAANAWAVTLAAVGRTGEARRRYDEGAATPLRPDFFHSVFATFRAMAEQVARRWNSPHWTARARAVQ